MNPFERRQIEELRATQIKLREQMAALDRKIDSLASAPPDEEPSTPPPLPVREIIPPKPPVSTPLPVTENIIATEPPRSFELELGTVWLVRIGIVILITGFVFLGNYAYQNFIAHIGAMGKVGLLYFAGALLVGVGAWLDRRESAKSKSMQNYARVLLAGGLATIYYTTYAAYFSARLHVIESPLVAGVLLLALAGTIIWLAEKKKSQTLAMFALLLSYYTSAINPLAQFTLFSNLLLTGAAVYFLVRNRWAAISFASLVATYLSFGYWRFFHGGELVFSYRMMGDEFWSSSLFLTGYWVLFTAAVFLARFDNFSSGKRAGFLSINNAALFAFVTFNLTHFHWDWFWIFALGLGVTLLALASLANRWVRDDLSIDAAYLAQGLLLVTIGLAAKITGYQLALVMAFESAALLACCRQRHGWIYQTVAAAIGLFAGAVALTEFEARPSLILPLGLVLALIFLFDARWVKHLRKQENQFDFRSAYFVLLGLLLGGRIIFERVHDAHRSPVLTAVALILVLTISLHGLPELAALGQFLVVVGVGEYFMHLDKATVPMHLGLLSMALVAANGLAVVQLLKNVPARAENRFFVHALYRIAAVAMFITWVFEYISAHDRFWVFTLAAVLIFSWGAVTKNRERLGIAAVIFLTGFLCFCFGNSEPGYLPDLCALLALLATQQAGRRLVNEPSIFHRHAQNAMIALGAAGLWFFVSRWIQFGERGFYLTVAWSLLAGAIFGAGIVLRERAYRICGLVILGFTVGRIFFVDVWQLETIYRIASFIVLGAVLLTLGFVYNKNAEKLRSML